MEKWALIPNSSGSKAAPLHTLPRLSAVVVTRSTGPILEFCLSGLLADSAVDEIVVVDNGERPEIASALRALRADRRDVRLIQGQGDVGLAQGLNLGSEQARGRWLLFVGPEVVVQPGAIDRLLKVGRGARTPAAIGGARVDGAGKAGRRGKRAKGKDPVQATSDLPGDLVLVGRADLDMMQGFRLEAEGAPFADLGRRLAAAGGDVLLHPTALGLPVRPGRVIARGFAARIVSLFTWFGSGRRR